MNEKVWQGMRRKRVLAVASGGGHFQQLMALRPAFAHHQTRFVTTIAGLAEEYDAIPVTVIRDCNRNDIPGSLLATFALAWTMLRFRPHVVISTGALPGVIALALGRGIGARTIWVDSVANAEEMSMSGRAARRFAHLWLSQWEEVAAACGAEYAGAVL